MTIKDQDTNTTEEVVEVVEKEVDVASLQKSLNWERGQRKSLEKELKALKEAKAADDEEDIKAAEESIRTKLKNSKSGLADDVIEDLMDTFGKSQAKSEVAQAKREVERELMEMKRNPLYMDVEEYGKEIRQLMKKGLTAEQAYWAVAGEAKLTKTTESTKEKVQKEEAQKLNKERAEQGFVDTVSVGAEKMPTYTEQERYIASMTGMSVEEVRDRAKATTMEEIQKLNAKYKK